MLQEFYYIASFQITQVQSVDSSTRLTSVRRTPMFCATTAGLVSRQGQEYEGTSPGKVWVPSIGVWWCRCSIQKSGVRGLSALSLVGKRLSDKVPGSKSMKSVVASSGSERRNTAAIGFWGNLTLGVGRENNLPQHGSQASKSDKEPSPCPTCKE